MIFGILLVILAAIFCVFAAVISYVSVLSDEANKDHR